MTKPIGFEIFRFQDTLFLKTNNNGAQSARGKGRRDKISQKHFSTTVRFELTRPWDTASLQEIELTL